MQQVITPDGRILYRTKLLDYDRAQSFALCLRANLDRFTGVEVEHSEKAKGQRAFFVTFQPTSADRLYDMVDREQDKRAQTAEREGADYLFMLDLDGSRPFYRVFNPHSGETYDLDSGECSCPDFEFRCKRASWSGLKCKHIVELLRRIHAGNLIGLADAYRLPAWRERHPLPQPVCETALPAAA